jgi:hypothetical protein
LNPTDITVSTILLNNSIGSELNPTAIGDFNGDGIPELMVKFSRSAVQAILEAGDSVAITVSGSFANGQRFTGNDAIRIIK